jgi:hypothetical protein
LQNGSFENGLTNWTVMNQRIDLGVTSIGGCTSQDTTNYSQFGGGGSRPTYDGDTGTFSGFSTSVVTTASGGLSPAAGIRLVELDLGSGSGNPFHVAHGPALYSDVFYGISAN